MALDIPILSLDEVIDPCVRVDRPISQPSTNDMDGLIAMYLHQVKELAKGGTGLESRLGQVQASRLALELFGFKKQLDGDEDWPDECEALNVSEAQVAGLIVLGVRAFDEYDWTKSSRAAGRLGILNLVLIMLGQH